MGVHRIKQGSTELEAFTIKSGSPPAAVDITNVTTVKWWQRAVGASANKVSGATCAVVSASVGTCTFDPASAAVGGGDAFEDAGDFQVYIELEWSDGDETRHPDAGYEIYTVEPNFE